MNLKDIQKRASALRQKLAFQPAPMGDPNAMPPIAPQGAPMDPAMMGGAPMDPAMAGGVPPMDPAMAAQGGMPMDPSMMAPQGAPMGDPNAIPPAGDPAMMGGVPPMDPNAMPPVPEGGMPEGGDPFAEIQQIIMQQDQTVSDMQKRIDALEKDLHDSQKKAIELQAELEGKVDTLIDMLKGNYSQQ